MNPASKLREIGITHWGSHNTGATNETGFTALPGGYRVLSYLNLGACGMYWTASGGGRPPYRAYFWSVAGNVFIDYWDANNGLSVRCVKD